MSRRAAALLAAILASLALAACGDDEEREGATATGTGTTGTAQEPTGEPVATVDMSLKDFELDPSDPAVGQAGVIEFALTNDGQAPHNLEVETPDGEYELEQDLQPGDSGRLRAEVREPGEYVIYCPVGDHRERGMEGRLVVGGADGGAQTDEPEPEAGGAATPGY